MLMIDNFDRGGSQRQTVLLANELLAREELRVEVGCLNRRGAFLEDLHMEPADVQEFPLRRFYDHTGLRAAYRLARHCRDRRIRLIHSFDFYSNVLAAMASLLSGETRLLASRRYRTLTDKSRHRWGERFTYAVSESVLFNSERNARWAVDEGLIPEEKVHVVPNGVALEDFAPSGLSDAPATTVGIVGRLHEKKGHDVLLEAFASVADSHDDLELIVVGDGELRPGLEDMAAKLGIASKVRWVGEQGDVPSWLRRFDIAVLASRSEGMPNVLLEYMAAGLPVVASDVAGVGEILRANGEHGLLVPPDDPRALASAITRLVEDFELRRSLGRAARERAQAFSMGAMTESVVSLYASILAR